MGRSSAWDSFHGSAEVGRAVDVLNVVGFPGSAGLVRATGGVGGLAVLEYGVLGTGTGLSEGVVLLVDGAVSATDGRGFVVGEGFVIAGDGLGSDQVPEVRGTAICS